MGSRHRLTALIVGGLLAAAQLITGVSGAAFSASTDNTGNLLSAAASFATPTFRVTTYDVPGGVFTGPSFDLALRQNLAPDYFVVVRGAAGSGGSTGNRSPAQDYARVVGDPFGNLGVTTPPATLRLERGAAGADWRGQITVVESLADGTRSGFILRDVLEVVMGPGATAATASTTWTDIAQVGLYGGIRGGGVATTATNRSDHMTGWARLYPSGSGAVHLERQAGGGGLLNGSTTFTVYVIEWGSEWNIQHVVVSGTGGGNGVDQASEYVTSTIAPVVRDHTFVLGYGITADNGIGDGWDGQVWTLGDGVTQNATESLVAVGAEYADGRTADLYVHEHPALRVDYRFGSDGGTPGIPTGDAAGTVDIDPTAASEAYGTTAGVEWTAGGRFTVVANSSNGTGTAYPRPIVWSRPIASATAQWERSRTGQPGAFWLQSIDLSGVTH